MRMINMSEYTSSTLEDLIDKIIDYRGKTPKKLNGNWTESGIPALSAKNIKNGKIVNHDSIRYIDNGLYNKWMKEEVKKGDILMTSEAPLGETYFLKDDSKICLSQRLFAIRVNDEIMESKFLYYYFNTDQGRNELLSRATGTTVGGIRQTALMKVVVHYPKSIELQQQIAGILSSYDDLVENNEKRIKILEEMTQRLYTEWFVKFRFPGYEKVKMVDSGAEYGVIPQEWEIRQLVSLTKYLSRGISPLYHEEGESRVINQKCIRNKRFDLELSRRQCKKIPFEKQVSFGDILINSTGVGTLGRVAQVYEKLNSCTVDSHVTILRPISEEYIDYLGLAVLNEQETFERLGVGATGQTELSRQAIGDVKLVVPSKEVASDFGRCIKPIRELTVTLQKNVNLAKQMRDILIPQMVSGKRELCNERSKFQGIPL